MDSFVIIVASAKNGVIGRGTEIPWDYPSDLSFFRNQTADMPVIMGRKTYNSIYEKLGHPLENRYNIVLSSIRSNVSGVEFDNVVHCESKTEAIRRANEYMASVDGGEIYVAGGVTVYEQFLPDASKIIRTEIPERPSGDVFFPKIPPEYKVEDEFVIGDGLIVEVYENVANNSSTPETLSTDKN